MAYRGREHRLTQGPEKAGFLIEATLRKRQVHRGMRVDIWVGSLLKGECLGHVS